MSNYPLGKNEADTITSKTGKKLSQITLEEVKRGNVTAEDIKISPEMLKRQGQVAREADNPQMEANFERAAELSNVPDDVILNMYNKLRPNRSTKRELDGAGASGKIPRSPLREAGAGSGGNL